MEQNHEGQNQAVAVCFYHPIRKAQAYCVQCGHPLCADCAEAGRILGGAKAGRSICFDCGGKLAEQNMESLKSRRGNVIKYFIKLLAAVVIGYLAGSLISAKFPGELLANGVASVICRLVFTFIGAILACASVEIGDCVRTVISLFGTSSADGWPVRILKLVIGVVFGFFAVLFKGTTTVVKKAMENIKTLKAIPDTTERNMSYQNQIMSYRRAAESSVQPAPAQAKQALSRVITWIVEDNVRLTK
ncbi:MAG TPA: hypothetical protein IAA57_09825 [Candidatus Pullilachnospira intestinigallinarum]|nr:hypothetical protein [Candidatus Pullilachnospira intestinigallinarum]